MQSLGLQISNPKALTTHMADMINQTMGGATHKSPSTYLSLLSVTVSLDSCGEAGICLAA